MTVVGNIAKLFLTLGPSLPDPAAQKNFTKGLTHKEKVILSMRGFSSAASMLLPAYHLWMAAEEVGGTDYPNQGYPQLILQSFLKDAMLNELLVALRRLYDPKLESLGAGVLAKMLDQADIRSLVMEYTKGRPACEEQDPIEADLHLKVIRERCASQLIQHAHELSPKPKRIEVQSYLARRAANKRAAHMTMDDYSIRGIDVQELVFEAVLIARLIQRVLGDGAYPGNYSEVDQGSYEASATVFHIRHIAGPLLNSLEHSVEDALQNFRTESADSLQLKF